VKWWVWILLAGPVLAGGLEAVLAAAGLVAFILGALWVAEAIQDPARSQWRLLRCHRNAMPPIDHTPPIADSDHGKESKPPCHNPTSPHTSAPRQAAL